MPPTTEPEHPPEGASTADLNVSFRRMYGVNRDELAATVPLAAVTLIGTAEIARIEHGRVVKTYPPAVEWIVAAKGLLHGLLAVQATGDRLLRASEDSAGLLDAARKDARDLAPLLDRAATLTAAAFPAELAPPARRILESMAALARRRAGEGRAFAGDMRAAMRQVEGDLEAVLDAVGEAVHASLVASLRAFREESRPQAWDGCLLLVCGPPFGRRDSIEVAAGLEVFGREALGTRVLYVDNVFTIPAAIAQLGAAVADRDLGSAVFGDPLRMWRDLLGDVARRHAGGGFFPFMGRE